MKQEPEFNTFIAPCRMVLHLWIFFIQGLGPAHNPIEILCRKTVFIVHAPDLPFGDLIFPDISFGLSDDPHSFGATWFNLNQDHIPVNRIILYESFKSSEILRLRLFAFTENVIPVFLHLQMFLATLFSPVFCSDLPRHPQHSNL